MERALSIAWAAGVLEGEGSFISKRTTGAPIVACQMTDRDVLEALMGVFGCGGLHATPKARDHFKDSWRWQAYGEAAAEVMRAVRPFMLARRAAAIDNCLAIWNVKQEKLMARRDLVAAAGAAYKDGKGSLREVATRFNVSPETVRQAAIREIPRTVRLR